MSTLLATNEYLELVRRFPLRPIRTKADYAAAAKMIDRLAVKEDSLSQDESDYLDVLSDLIEAYDQEHNCLISDSRSPLDRLKYLMQQSGTSTSDLGRIIGSLPAASMVLSGERELSKAQIRKLAAHFKVDAGYFL